MPAVLSPDPPLWERYTRGRGRVHLTGLQALVRLVLEQLRRDERVGRRVGAVVSGYPGSPLAGFDQLLRSLAPLLERAHVRFVPGLNEELAATAVAGTQLLETFPRAHWDGALGLFFAKAPGLDRALDALRHANFSGSARLGGALAVVGDDPFAKSSSLPSHSEHAFAHAWIPLFAPSDPEDVLRLGLAAFALSRYSGLWSGMRVMADVADAGKVFELGPESDFFLPAFEVEGEPFAPRFDTNLLPPNALRIERELVFGRLEAVRRFAAANPSLNPITSSHPKDKVGLLAAGSLYRELERALELLGVDETVRERLGIRLMKIELVWPLEATRVREFAKGLSEIVVVDARRGQLEESVCAALYGSDARPPVLGQRGPNGELWLARRPELSGATLAQDLGPYLADRLRAPGISAKLDSLTAAAVRAEKAPPPTRAPHFCSGCPHSASTRVPLGSLAGGGIGCHTMALFMPEREVRFIGAMGCEGAQWIGLSPWTSTGHLFQNLGDGTYFHSGRLAVRACVAADVPITFKLLWNGVVAMTGGQRAIGSKSLSALVRDLLSDGVRQIAAMTDDPELREMALRDPRLRRVAREDWDAAMRELREQPGVTALIWDELCANEKQRLERRGLRAKPNLRLAINEDVCEGCGDCGAKSACVSLRPVETALGRKTRLHESSCSDDRACLEGDCPAFVAIETPKRAPEPFESRLAGPLPDPPPLSWDGRLSILLVGIGSTGVVTIDALLVRAAEHDGLYAAHLDQTGLAQRGGKVVSHCILSTEPSSASPRIEAGRADVLLAFDPLGAADRDALRALDPGRTHAVAHSLVAPTGADVSNPRFRPAEVDAVLAPLAGVTRSLALLPAEHLADAALGQPLSANLVLLGFAWQRGLIPLSARALERAIRDNGVAVESNLRAFALGRAVAVDPALAAELVSDVAPPAIGDEESLERAERQLGAGFAAVQEALGRFPDAKHSAALLRRIAGFATDLVDYQSKRLALRYCARIAAVAEAEAVIEAESPELTAVAARELYRVLAYKDEYEVARLLLRGPQRRWLRRHSQSEPRLRYFLHPPLLRALGLRRKMEFGPDFDFMLQALASLRGLRGTVFDPFGYTRARRLERELAHWYDEVLDALCGALRGANHSEAVAIAALTEEIRGFESIKEGRAARVRPVVEARLAALGARPLR
jgi:indolepyruvate ferredoxin oxidoreductase